MKNYLACALSLSLAAAAFAADTAYTAESLEKVVKELGYPTKIIENMVAVEVTSKGRKFDIGITVTPERLIMSNFVIRKIKDPSAVPAKIWRGLLEASYKSTPAFFAADDNDLMLYRLVSNKPKDAARWRTLIDEMATTVMRSFDLWAAPEVLAQRTAGPDEAASPSPAPSPSPAK